MKAGSVSAVRTVIAVALGLVILASAFGAGAITPDAACLADSLYLVSPDLINLSLQSSGRQGMVISWPDLDLAESTCFALTATDSAEFEATVTGGYGGLVDRSFLFTTSGAAGTIGAAQPDPLVYSWRSDGPSYYGSLGGTLNLANNGGLWRFDQMAGSWGQLNVGLPMTWPQTNILALDEADDGTMVAGFSTGPTTSTSPAGLWIFREGSWSQLAPEIFDDNTAVSAVAFSPASASSFVVGTERDGPFLTTDGGATFVSLLNRLPQDLEQMPTIYPVNSLIWTPTRMLIFVPYYGLFVSEDSGATFSRQDIEVVRDLDAPRARITPGGVLGDEMVRMRGTVDVQLSGSDTAAGELDGYERTLSMDVLWEFHTAARTAGDDVQTFAAQLMMLDSQLVGDSDFELFRITAGDSLGLASPGQITLTRQPDGKFRAEGYFDVNYRVEIDGALRGPFQGIHSNSTGTTRFTLGDEALSELCDLADNGFGTVEMPPQCDAGYVGSFTLTAGFPAGVSFDVHSRIYNYLEFKQLPLVNQIVENPSNPDHLLAAVNFHGLIESDDGGYTWHPVRGDLIQASDEIDGAWVHNGLSVAVDPLDPQVILLALQQEGIYRTGDGGETWAEVAGENVAGTVQPSNLGSLVSIQLISDDDNPGTFYAVEDKWSLLASTDNGVNWDHFASQPVMDRALVGRMAADGSGDLLVGTWGGGIYVPGTPLDLTQTYNSSTDVGLRDVLDLGLSIAFTAGAATPADSLYLKCQTFQGWAVWRATGVDREGLTLLGLYDRVNPESCIEGFCGDESYDVTPQCFISKRSACFDFSTPDTVRFFDDEIYNGFEYYYGVTSFDYGSTALTTPQNNSQAMVFSPRWEGDTASPFPGGGNTRSYQVNLLAAPATGADEEIYVYPNPLRPGEGFRDFEGQKVVFTNLPPESTIQIFTAAGDKVIELGSELQVEGNIHWDCHNEKGKELTGGVFLYKVLMPQRDDFWGKLVIIR